MFCCGFVVSLFKLNSTVKAFNHTVAQLMQLDMDSHVPK